MAEPKKKTAQLPDGITMAQLKENWDTASREYRKAIRRMQLLDAADRGRMWEALKAKCLPCYQILPDKGHISAAQAKAKAEQEYEIFNRTQIIDSDFDKQIRNGLKSKRTDWGREKEIEGKG